MNSGRGSKLVAIPIATINDVRAAETVIRQHLSAAPLIRSWPLEKVLVAIWALECPVDVGMIWKRIA